MQTDAGLQAKLSLESVTEPDLNNRTVTIPNQSHRICFSKTAYIETLT